MNNSLYSLNDEEYSINKKERFVISSSRGLRLNKMIGVEFSDKSVTELIGSTYWDFEAFKKNLKYPIKMK